MLFLKVEVIDYATNFWNGKSYMNLEWFPFGNVHFQTWICTCSLDSIVVHDSWQVHSPWAELVGMRLSVGTTTWSESLICYAQKCCQSLFLSASTVLSLKLITFLKKMPQGLGILYQHLATKEQAQSFLDLHLHPGMKSVLPSGMQMQTQAKLPLVLHCFLH